MGEGSLYLRLTFSNSGFANGRQRAELRFQWEVWHWEVETDQDPQIRHAFSARRALGHSRTLVWGQGERVGWRAAEEPGQVLASACSLLATFVLHANCV